MGAHRVLALNVLWCVCAQRQSTQQVHAACTSAAFHACELCVFRASCARLRSQTVDLCRELEAVIVENVLTIANSLRQVQVCRGSACGGGSAHAAMRHLKRD
eukprot:758861-Pleurochrysis_carterae.AAC.1